MSMVVDALATVGPFQDLPPDVVQRLGQECAAADRAAGETIYNSVARMPPCVFLIVRGRVEILQADGTAGLVPLGQTGAGGLVGEFSAIDGVRGRCVVRTRSATQVVTIPQHVFRALLEQHACVALHLLRDMTGVIRSLNERVASLQGAHAEFGRIRNDLFRFTI